MKKITLIIKKNIKRLYTLLSSLGSAASYAIHRQGWRKINLNVQKINDSKIMIKRLIKLVGFIPAIALSAIQLPFATLYWIIKGEVPKSILQILVEW